MHLIAALDYHILHVFYKIIPYSQYTSFIIPNLAYPGKFFYISNQIIPGLI